MIEPSIAGTDRRPAAAAPSSTSRHVGTVGSLSSGTGSVAGANVSAARLEVPTHELDPTRARARTRRNHGTVPRAASLDAASVRRRPPGPRSAWRSATCRPSRATRALPGPLVCSPPPRSRAPRRSSAQTVDYVESRRPGPRQRFITHTSLHVDLLEHTQALSTSPVRISRRRAHRAVQIFEGQRHAALRSPRLVRRALSRFEHSSSSAHH